MSRVPRLRMFAGPNGSGKSTIKSVIRPELLGVYINPDDIEEEFRLQSFLDLGAFGVSAAAEEVFSFFRRSELLKKADLSTVTESLRIEEGALSFHQVEVNSYLASAIADFIRHELLVSGTSFTNRTYIFDNSSRQYIRLAEVTDGKVREMKSDSMPVWFQRAVWDKLMPSESQ